jgi:hypothetical protein
MHDYEIRILNSKRGSLALIEILEPSDNAAIRSAERIANGRPVEVWQDIDCIYRSDALANGMRPAA